MIRFRVLTDGAWRVVAKVDHRGRCEVEQALNELAVNPKTRAVATGLLAVWAAIPREGPHELPVETYHCVNSENEIYEFIKGSYRVLCFRAEGRMVVAACVFLKKSRKTPDREVARAIALRKEYLQARAKCEVEFVD